MFSIPNPVKIVSDAADFVGDGIKAGVDLVGGTVKAGADLLVNAGTKVASPIIDLIAQPFRPGLLDQIVARPTPTATGKSNTGDPTLDATLDAIGPLNKEIVELTKKLESASPEEKMTIMLQIQQKSQLVQQLVSMQTSISKSKHDTTQQVNGNLR